MTCASCCRFPAMHTNTSDSLCGVCAAAEQVVALGENEGRAFKRILERAKLPLTIRVHDLRHTAATDMISAGLDIPTVQYITGHRDSAVLLEIYAHSHQERNRTAMDRVEELRKREA